MTLPQDSAANLPREGFAFVWDTNATRGERAHDFGGLEVVFKDHRSPVEVPMENARLVAHIPSFRVIGASGEQYLPAGKPEPSVGPAMRNDQVVATLDELTLQALKARAKAWEGHNDYDAVADKAGQIRFIMARLAEKPVVEAKGKGDETQDDEDFVIPTRESDGEVIEVTPAQLSAIASQKRAA